MKLNHELKVLNHELTQKTDDLSKANLNIQNFNRTLKETVERQVKEIAGKEEILSRIIEIGKFINSSLDLNKTRCDGNENLQEHDECGGLQYYIV